ncbi:hypothetical protein DB88DRAFT_539801 [Papiliotrema laurentii]|uniref:Myb-like domain-containing protein n=1 Tax=Papiliotrema laurentii TaxID=5418 RepID=A0AAD9L635_PAPLA|nr:hypothetical protein DB88DRAFT_539801 [Papiliotrema laurentii]
MPAVRTQLATPKAAAREIKASVKQGGPTYDKCLLVTLIVKQVSPDWGRISSVLNDKTESKAHDLWRKVILPALSAGRAWSTSTGGSWSSAEKIKLVTMIIEDAKVDWDIVARAFPERSKTQVRDVWRKGVFPKIKKGEAVS